MSRTYRKSKYTESRSKKSHIEKEIDYRNNRVKAYYIFTNEGVAAYNKAMEEYEAKLKKFENSSSKYKFLFDRPLQPNLSEFFILYYTKLQYDYDKVVLDASDEYDSFKRDGKFYVTNRNTSFKKFCARELRVVNRNLISKILKDEDGWDSKPYPDTYLGKTHIWDYW